MSKAFKSITNLIIIVLAFFTILFAGMGTFELIDGMKVYTISEDSLLYALEDGRYGDLVADYHRNIVSDIKSTETMEECYAIARYYEAALDYKLAVQENDPDFQKECRVRMNAAADDMGELSYARDEINLLLGI